MKLAKVYETSDGKRFARDDQKAAKRHQAWVDLIALCDSSLHEVYQQTAAGDALAPADLAARLSAKADELQRILRAKPERAPEDTP